MSLPPLQGSLILKILRGKYPPLTGYSKELTDIVKSCLTLVSFIPFSPATATTLHTAHGSGCTACAAV